MKKLLVTILSAVLVIAAIATPTYKVNSPSFNIGSHVSNDNANGNRITTQ